MHESYAGVLFVRDCSLSTHTHTHTHTLEVEVIINSETKSASWFAEVDGVSIAMLSSTGSIAQPCFKAKAL